MTEDVLFTPTPMAEKVDRPNGTTWRYRTASGRRVVVEQDAGGAALVVLRTRDREVAAEKLAARWEALAPGVDLPEPAEVWRVMAQPDGGGKLLYPAPSDGHHRNCFPGLVYPLPEGVDGSGLTVTTRKA